MIIYKTTNLINGKIYVGKDSNNNPTYFGSGLILNKAIKKYGINNFKKEILENCSSSIQLNSQEQYWISTLDSTNKKIGYNIALGGCGGDTFTNQSEDSKFRLLKLRNEKIKNYWDKPENKLKISNRMKEQWKDPKFYSGMSSKMKGREITWKQKISNSIKKWHSLPGNRISPEKRKEMNSILKLKMTGKEIKVYSPEIELRVVNMYETMGPIIISEKLKESNIQMSPYVVKRILKKNKVYKKCKRGRRNFSGNV